MAQAYLMLQVYNFLPSISAVIGEFSPQSYVWRVCIALHAPQRIMTSMVYYNYHTAVNMAVGEELYKAVAAFNSVLGIVEVFSLLCLTMVSSTENYS